MIFPNVKDNVRIYEADPAKVKEISKENADGSVDIKEIFIENDKKYEPIISVEEMRRADAYTITNFVPSKELMYRAAYGVFLAIKSYCPVFKTPRVAIISGSGNNGGDGYALAQILNEHGADVTIFRVSEKLSEDGAYYLDFCRKAQIPEVLLYEDSSADALSHANVSETAGTQLEGKSDFAACEALSAETDAAWSEVFGMAALNSLADFDIIADCILGTGFSGVPRKAAAETIININLARKTSVPKDTDDIKTNIAGPRISRPYIVSVDINSGLNGDTGEAALAVKSDLTVSIGYIKHGQLTENAAKYTGKLVCADIGILLLSKDCDA